MVIILKRKKRYKIKKIKVLITLILSISTILLLFNAKDIITHIKLKYLDYNTNTIKILKDIDIDITYYSKTLDNISNTKYFNKNNINYYLEINYKDEENFLENINKLIEIGYSVNDINIIYEKLNDVTLITNRDYNKNITNILTSDYFKLDNLERYLDYKDDNAVLNVNMNLDYEFYTHDIEIDTIDNLVIVNKYYKLNKDYVPETYKLSSKYAINERQFLTKEAKEAFEKMCDAAREEKINLYSGSGYRSYSYQNTLYNNRVKSDGLEYANQTAAKAGYSEHQTGLAIDITKNKRPDYLDSNDIEFKWLMENAHKYGFILRYPEGKEHITGYSYEPWHFRYITVEIASILKEKNITYEEYVGMFK